MAVKKSIAIIGEGETEWWYFDTLRIACRYKFKVAPDFPQVIWIETNPCTEFWFLLHFLPQISTKHYETYEDVLPAGACEELIGMLPFLEEFHQSRELRWVFETNVGGLTNEVLRAGCH